MRARNFQGVGIPVHGGSLDPIVVCELAGKPASRFETSRLGPVDPEIDEDGELRNFCCGDSLAVSIFGGSKIGNARSLLALAELPGEEFDRDGGFEGAVRVGVVTPEPVSDSEAEEAAAALRIPPDKAWAEIDVRLLVLPPEVPEAAETSIDVATARSHELRGHVEEVGPAMVYVTEPPASVQGTAKPLNCVLIVHDAGGMDSGRHRQLADALALQGWLVALPDFSANSPVPQQWFQDIQTYCFDYFLPWLEEREVEAVAMLGLGLGCLPCAHTAAVQQQHLAGGSKIPRFVGTALAYPRFVKPHILNDGELQKAVALMAGPILALPVAGSQKEVLPGGLMSLECEMMNIGIDVVIFDEVPRGFLTDGDLASEPVVSAVTWAVEACSAFFHRILKASEAEEWRMALHRPPEEEAEKLDV